MHLKVGKAYVNPNLFSQKFYTKGLNLTLNKTSFHGPSKLTTPQVCHNHLREATHTTIKFRHFQVSVNFLTAHNTVSDQVLADDNVFSEVLIN